GPTRSAGVSTGCAGPSRCSRASARTGRRSSARSSSSRRTSCTRTDASGSTRNTSFDDSLPRIYEEVTGEAFPRRGTDASGLRAEDWDTLREVCGDDQAVFDLQVALLGVERQYRGMARRAGIYEALGERLRSGLFGSEQEAVEVLSERLRRRQKATQGALFRLGLPVVDAPQGGGGGARSVLEQLTARIFRLYQG